MKKIVFCIFLLVLALPVFSQRGILFTNKVNQREILVREGDLVKFSYNGYLGQKEVKSGVVLSIQDSIVGIISTVSSGKFSTGATETRYILVRDLTGFRKFRRSRPYLMTLSNVAITVGTVLLFYAIDKNTDMTFAEKFGLSVGTGLVTTIIVRAAFPERIKNRIGEEWEVRVLK